MTHIAGLFEVAINGQPFRLAQGDYARRFLDVIRQQADNSGEPSEFSLNPNDLWRRSQSEWVFGEGQLYFDDNDGLRRRYYTGDGVEPFCGCKKIHPHKAAARVDTLGGTLDYQDAVSTSNAIYVRSAGVATLQKFDSAQSTTSAADGANAIVEIVTVGNTLLAATSGGIFKYDEGGDTWSLANVLVPTLMAYIKGRLMVAVGVDIYNITDLTDTAAPASLTGSFVDQSFVWTAFGDSAGFILAAGVSGERSHLYQITIREDGTALTSPVEAAQFPDGEQVRDIVTYLGVTVLATNEGVRIGVFSGDALVYGPLVYEGSDVWALEPQGKFVFYTMNGGVGKLNLAEFIPGEELEPAYASSYKGTDDLPVYAVFSRPAAVTMGDNSDYEIMFLQDTNGGVDDGGLFEAQTTYVTQDATFDTGRISYGMADRKNFMFLEALGDLPDPDDQILVFVVDQDDNESLLGALNGASERRTFFINETNEFISFRFKFINGDINYVVKPELLRWTLRALPVPNRTEQIQIPLDIRASQLMWNGSVDLQDVWTQYSALQGLVRSGATVTYEEFDRTYLASLENIQLGPDLDVDINFDDWEGVALVTLRIYDTTVISSGLIDSDDGDDTFGFGLFGMGTFADRT